MTAAEGRLGGKVALVTGASSGIGEATALGLAREGAAVLLVARRAERLDALRDRIRAAGAQASVLALDLTQPGAPEAATARAVSDFGHLDIVVNNAGLMLLGPVAGAPAGDWERMLNLNVLALMQMSRAALEVMQPQGHGHIVNVSSVSGRGASPTSAGYSASKWAVGGFSEGLRQEARLHGVRVTVIEPGVVATELTEHITHAPTKDAYEGRVRQMTPLEPEDVAAAVIYAVTQPPRVNVNELLLRPLDQG